VSATTWLIDGNNVFGSRPDGWWNDREAAMRRLAQSIAEWCRTHEDPVVLVFDGPVDATASSLQGGNLRIEAAPYRRRDAADDRIVELAGDLSQASVVTADEGLRRRLSERCGDRVELIGVGRFRDLIGY
jgi:predicted RNA-binding protein with PIN domain